tara:strand:- start:115 stop:504 length:390 start_codon:yes stop_codon:yes gene_type:complete
MKIKVIDKDDYILITEWWKHYDWEPVHPYLLSNNGYIISDEDKNIVAGWYVKTNTQTALIEWIVKNPKTKPKKFIKGLSLLCKTIEEQAKQDGYKMIITFLKNDKLKKFMKRRKYESGDTGINNFLKAL